MASTINSDNGVVSGSAGLKSTADSSGVLALQSNGTTGLSLNTSLALGVGSSPSYGTSGQVLTSAGSAAAPTWSTVSAAPSVTNYSNQSANVTLTSANANYLLSFTLANDITVTLPDATTLTSAKNFEIKNNSTTYGIYINDAAGNYIFSIPPQTDMRFWTTSVATAAGAWVTGSLPMPYLSGYTLDIPAVSQMQNSIDTSATLSATQSVMVLPYLNGLYAVVVTNTAGVISYGTPAFFSKPTSGGYTASITALTSTTGIVIYPEPNAAQAYLAVSFTVSGTNITFGAVSTINTTSNSSTATTSIAALSSTTAVAVYSTSSTAAKAVVLTLSGGVVSAGAEASFGSRASGTLFQVAALSATSFVLGYTVGAAGNAVAATISGTTITIGTPVASGGNASVGVSIAALSATNFIAGNIGTSGNVFAGTVSGTTITVGTQVSFFSTAPTTGAIVALSSTTGVFAADNSVANGMVARTVSVSGNTVTAGASSYTVLSTGSGQASYAGTSLVGLQTIAPGVPSTSSVMLYVNQTATTNFATRNQNLTISGSVVTANTANTYAASNGTYTSDPTQRVAMISGTQFVRVTQVASADGTAGLLVARLYGVSGTTITLQNTVTVATDGYTGSGQYAVFPVSATLVCVLYANSSQYLIANTISISGTSLTLNTPITVDTASTFGQPSGVTLSSSLLVISYADTTSFLYKFRTLSLSGTTLSANTAITVTPSATSTYTASLAALSSTYVAGIFVINSSGYYATMFSLIISGTTVTFKNLFATTQTIGNIEATSRYNVIALSSTRALYTYGQTSPTPYPLKMAIVDFTASGTGAVTYALSYGNIAQPTGYFYGLSAATSATSGVVFAYNNGSNYGPVLLGQWSITSGGISMNVDNSNSWNYAATTDAPSIFPITTAAFTPGLQSAKQFITMASESTSGLLTGASPASAQGATIRKYSVAGTVNN